ncbi:MAG TPA: DinB family protein [Streptosporangiaceae bacterium]|nr:DinB family protein [Streptosporangiaceae bacterium]
MPDTGLPSDGELPERKFAWWDMFVAPEDDPREAGGDISGERDVLVRYLRDHRLTLELKCAGLDAAAMAQRSVPPSTLSLLGLVRHLAGVERYWFRIVVAGQDVPRLYRSSGNRDEPFDDAVPDPAVVAEAWEVWRAEVSFAEELTANAPSLDITGEYHIGDDHGTITLREVLVHMVEEYARHNGHADLLRERIDGRVGQ